MKSLREWSAALLLLALPVAVQATARHQITILHTNDHHGRFWENRYQEYGMAARKTVIDRIRAEAEKTHSMHVLLLSGGDINTGVPESDLLNAEPDFKGMRLLGYDAMALGNHEFDKPPPVLRQQMQWAGFPFLSANILDQRGETVFQTQLIKNLGGLRVGILGFTTTETKTSARYGKLYQFADPVKIAQKLVPRLRSQVDLLIGLTHMGHYDDGKHGPNRHPGDVKLARAVKGFDVIVGGHSQVALHEPDLQNGTLIVQAKEWGKYVGRLDLFFEKGELDRSRTRYQLIPINHLPAKKKSRVRDLRKKVAAAQKDYPSFLPDLEKELTEALYRENSIVQNVALRAFLLPFRMRGQKQLMVPVGKTEQMLLGRKSGKGRETNLGRLIATAFRWKLKGAIAFQNNGGVRDDIEPGVINYRDILRVLPFNNTLCTGVVKGWEFKVMMGDAINENWHYAGVKISTRNKKIDAIMVDGKPLSPQGTYRMVSNCYSAEKVDARVDFVKDLKVVDTGYSDARTVVEYLKERHPVIKKGEFQEPSVIALD